MSSPPSKEEEEVDEASLISQVVEVTGTNSTEAAHLLGACANNVEAAVALFFEQGADGESNGGASTSSAAAAAALAASGILPIDDNEDEVRAPIAPIREQLIGPEDDNFYAAAPPRLARVLQRVKVCPLRDFAREGALMEEQLAAAAAAAADTFGPSSSSHTRSSGGPRRRVARAAAMVVAAHASADKSSTSRLGDLFRPPTDIAYAGTFQTARLRATELKHWLLVNVQSDNFDSQVLNRDVWSDKKVRGVLKRQFMLWQVDSDSSEGLRFVAFYHCAKLPYVCVIDPRTGEEIWKNPEPKQANMLPDLQQFLRDHNDFSRECADDAPSTSAAKRRGATINIDCDPAGIDEDEEDATAGGAGNPKKRTKLLELSEEEQIALAIRNSMGENGGDKASAAAVDGGGGATADVDAGSDFDSVEEFGEDDTKATCELISYEQQLGVATNELTMLKLRLLNASGADDEVVQLRWPSDTKMQVLRLYIAQQQPHIPKLGYKLICAYPRKTLEAQHNASTLKELGLHPSANLHVTLDD